MFRRFVAVLALALLTTRCADHTTTTAFEPPVSGALPQAGNTPHFLRWAGTATPQFKVSGSGQGSSNAQETAPLSLDQYSVSFWAVRGQARSAVIRYKDASGHSNAPFLQLTITDPVTLPDGSTLAEGDSVRITINIDTTKVGVSLEPTGLQFGEAAQMQMWYGGADGDLNGDGVVDATDGYVESQLLGMWYREGDVSDWSRIPATQLLSAKSFIVALPHFSQYAVSW
jgi:hypothetical protein